MLQIRGHENAFNIGKPTRGLLFDVNETVTYLGKVDVTTKWGLRDCDHYNITDAHTGGYYDELLYHGVVAKLIHELTVNDPVNGPEIVPNVYDLMDTNLDELVNP